jgi:hypothetical protein
MARNPNSSDRRGHFYIPNALGPKLVIPVIPVVVIRRISSVIVVSNRRRRG